MEIDNLKEKTKKLQELLDKEKKKEEEKKKLKELQKKYRDIKFKENHPFLYKVNKKLNEMNRKDPLEQYTK